MSNTEKKSEKLSSSDLKLLILVILIVVAVVISVVMVVMNNSGTSNTRSSNGFTISYDGNEATITGYTSSDETVTIPAKISGKKVVAIAVDAFKSSSVKSLIFSDNIEDITIPSKCFQNNTTLQYVKFPSSLTIINSYAFSGCTSLEHVDFSDNTTTIGEYAFYGCTKLKYSLKDEKTDSIYLPTSLVKIEQYAFYNCSNMDNVYYYNKLVTVSDYAFYGCSTLDKFELLENPNNDDEDVSNVTSIGKYAFYKTTLTSTSTNPLNVSNVTTIGEYAFASISTNFAYFVLPISVKSIGNYAFSGCSALTTFIFTEKTSGSLSLGNGIFKSDVRLTKVATQLADGTEKEGYSLPSCISTIPAETFMGCIRLLTSNDFYISSEIVTIGSGAFAIYLTTTTTTSNDATKKIVVSEDNDVFSLVELAPYYVSTSEVTTKKHYILTNKDETELIAYFGSYLDTNHGKYNNSDTPVTTFKFIPNTITKIGDYAFAGALFTKLALPASVNSVGNNFLDSSKIDAVYFQNKDCVITSKSFTNVVSNDFQVLVYFTSVGELYNQTKEYFPSVEIGSYSGELS